MKKKKSKRKPISDETKEKIRQGHLGKKNSLEARIKMSKAHRALCDFGIRLCEYQKKENTTKKDGRVGKMPKAMKKPGKWMNIRRGYYSINGKSLFFRSRMEANIALYLDFLVKQKQIKGWTYEKDVFIFEKISFGTRSYRPDFKIINNNDRYEYWEVKGWMDENSKTKLCRFKKYYPKEFKKFRIIIDDPFSRSKENGKVMAFLLDKLKMNIKDIMSYKGINKRLGGLIPNWEC